MDKFEEIVNKLAEQEGGVSDDPDEERNYQAGFRAACNLLRPLLDGWKDVNIELPEKGKEVLIAEIQTNMNPILAVSYFEKTTKSKYSGRLLHLFPDGQDEQPGHYFASYWRELPDLPGDYSALEALITNKK